MRDENPKTDSVLSIPESCEELKKENIRLLNELELAYSNLERILEETKKEKEIAYKELQWKFEALENLYQELSRKENLLVHMEKLSSIGQFITELIHELNSPLTAITLQSQLAILKDIPDNIKVQFENIAEQANRMSNLLGRFKAMAYKGKEDFKLFDINENLKKTIETIEIIKSKSMTIELVLGDEELLVWGDPYQIQQIYLNLAKNAFDAMKDKGNILKVRTRKASSSLIQSLGENGVVFSHQNSDWTDKVKNGFFFALVEFIDQGSGIPYEILREIFQPFFTTKERGKGTGLGLSICSDIALRHGGNVAVKSMVGKGTNFQLILPLASNQNQTTSIE